MCAILYREWEDERETYRLKRVINWAFGGKEQGAKTECSHERHDRLPSGELKCKDCGEAGY